MFTQLFLSAYNPFIFKTNYTEFSHLFLTPENRLIEDKFYTKKFTQLFLSAYNPFIFKTNFTNFVIYF